MRMLRRFAQALVEQTRWRDELLRYGMIESSQTVCVLSRCSQNIPAMAETSTFLNYPATPDSVI